MTRTFYRQIFRPTTFFLKKKKRNTRSFLFFREPRPVSSQYTHSIHFLDLYLRPPFKRKIHSFFFSFFLFHLDVVFSFFFWVSILSLLLHIDGGSLYITRNTTDIGSTTAHLLTKWKHRKRKSFFSSLIISSSYTALHNPFLSFFILFSHKSRPIPRRSNVCIFVFQFKRFSLLCCCCVVVWQYRTDSLSWSMLYDCFILSRKRPIIPGEDGQIVALTDFCLLARPTIATRVKGCLFLGIQHPRRIPSSAYKQTN